MKKNGLPGGNCGILKFHNGFPDRHQKEDFMIVGDRMSHPVITVSPELPILEALDMMRREHIRRTPVVQDGKLLGIVSQKNLLNAAPSSATLLSFWEMPIMMSKVKIKDVMTASVLTIREDTPIEEAARIMADNKVGGLPVMRQDKMVGIITETDLFKVLLEMMGAREKGVRINVRVPNRAGEIAKLSQAIFNLGGNIIALGTSAGEDPSTSTLTLKVVGPEQEKLQALVEPLVLRLTDIRTC
jgi:acetoin utilization protein AcuB